MKTLESTTVGDIFPNRVIVTTLETNSIVDVLNVSDCCLVELSLFRSMVAIFNSPQLFFNAQIMRTHEIQSIPVFDTLGNCIGIIDVLDICGYIATSIPDEQTLLRMDNTALLSQPIAGVLGLGKKRGISLGNSAHLIVILSSSSKTSAFAKRVNFKELQFVTSLSASLLSTMELFSHGIHRIPVFDNGILDLILVFSK